MRTVVAVALLVCGTLAGCVVENYKRPYNVNKAAAAQTVCKYEQPTGTHLTRRVCRTPEQRAEDEAAKQTWMNRYPATPVHGDMSFRGFDVRHAPPDEPEQPELPPWREPPEDPEGVNQPVPPAPR